MLARTFQDFRFETLSGPQGPEALAAWTKLNDSAVEPAPTHAAALIFPFADKNSEILSVSEKSELLLAFPMVRKRLLWKSWASPITNSSLPHLDKSRGDHAVMALVNMLHKPFLFQALPMQSEFYKTLQRHAPTFHVLSQWQRASLNISGTFDQWQKNNFDHKRRKEFKRLRNRLSEQGQFEFCCLHHNADASPFITDFLTLEAAGWKGHRGTALNADPATAEALRKSLAQLHTKGDLLFWSFKINGKCVASLFAMKDGNKAALGKIAYDEHYARYSPGSLLVLAATENLFDRGDVMVVDSSAIPSHPMIDRIWRDRIAMADVLVKPASLPTPLFNAIVAIEKARRAARNGLRDFYYRLKGEARS